MKNNWHYLFALIFLFIGGCTSSATNGIDQTHYQQTQHIFLADTLPPPPQAGSGEEKTDLASVLHAQKSRTPQQIKEAQLDAELSVFRFQSALGKNFTRENLPYTSSFFNKLKEDEDQVVQLAKQHFMRRRPYTLNLQVKPVIAQPANASYPSGHACFAYVNAIFLAKMLPEKSTEIFKRADRFAGNRVIAGVHYPTDVQAGKISATVIAEELLHDTTFMQEFNLAKKETRDVLFK